MILTGIMSICYCSCYKSDKFENIDSDIVIQVLSSNDSIRADDASTSKVIVKISESAVSAKRKVLFVTTLGTFIGGKDSLYVQANKDFIAEAYLRSNKAGAATVTAIIENVTATNKPTIKFYKAFPDAILVRVDSFGLDSGFNDELLITASLSTISGGKPTTKCRVDFKVIDHNSQNIGFFLNGQNYGFTDQDGNVKIRFTAGTAQVGYDTVIAQTVNLNGDTLTARTIIHINN